MSAPTPIRLSPTVQDQARARAHALRQAAIDTHLNALYRTTQHALIAAFRAIAGLFPLPRVRQPL